MSNLTQKEVLLELRNFRQIFSGIERELEKIPSETEGEFLSISSHLHNCYERTWILADLFSMASVLLSGHEMAGAIDGMRNLAEKMDESSKGSEVKTQKRIESFNEILNSIENIRNKLDEFRKISRSLRILSTVTNVHGTSFEQDKQGKDFSLLVRDISKLADVILSKSAAVKTGLNGISKKINFAVSRMMVFKERQYREMGSVLLYIKSSLDMLTRKYSSATDEFGHTSEWSQGISRSIEKVVMSIQYHDITLQKFDRSRKSFVEMSEKITGANGGQDVRELLKELVVFCDGQLEAICKSRDELSEAVANIVSSMRDISRNAIALSERTHMMTASASLTGRTFFTEMGGSLAAVKATLSELNETNLEVSKAVGSINSVMGDITLLVSEIEGIGKSANLIAMSVVRKASQIGKSGVPVGFLASSIQKLWSASQSLTAGILQSLESITSLANSLSTEIKVDIDNAPSDTQSLEQEMISLISTLSGLNNYLTSHLSNMEEEVQALSREIDTVSDRTDFLDNVIGIIDGVVSVTGDMVKNINKSLLSDIRASDPRGYEASESEQSEQSEHKSYLQKLIEGAGDSISLTKSILQRSMAEDASKCETNRVELFDSRHSLEEDTESGDD